MIVVVDASINLRDVVERQRGAVLLLVHTITGFQVMGGSEEVYTDELLFLVRALRGNLQTVRKIPRGDGC